MLNQHRFGGQWTAAKISALREYLTGYLIALKKQGFYLYYVDGFAGSGSYVIPDRKGRLEALRGSARIALETVGFQSYIFIEKSSARCRELSSLIEEFPDADVSILCGDANLNLQRICQNIPWNSSRAVIFLDPYGLQVEWRTLQSIAATGSVDVWYLFPLSGVTRQLALSSDKVDEAKARSLNRIFGTDDWKGAFYSEPLTDDIFGMPQPKQRHADSTAIVDWMSARLRSIFPKIHQPALLRLSKGSGPHSGPPLFALYFLISSRSKKAQTLAMRIASGVYTKLRRENIISK